MKNIFIINTHESYPFSEGKLNQTLVEKAKANLENKGYDMGVPWSFKKYIDLVYSAGTDGRLCDGDGRTRSDPSRQYGSG